MSGKNRVNVFQPMTVDNQKNVRTVEKFSIGTQLKAIRTKNNLTLEEASKLTRLAPSTLSKIENEQISPTFTVMKKLASGLNIELPQLFTKPKVLQPTARRDITLCDTGKVGEHLRALIKPFFIVIRTNRQVLLKKTPQHRNTIDTNFIGHLIDR